MKQFSLLFLCLAFAGFLQAQISFGPKLGLNYAGLSFSNNEYTTSRVVGFQAGGFINYALNKLALQAEVSYSTEGNKWTFKSLNSDGKIKTSQLRIPLLIQYQFTKNFFVEAGPQYTHFLSMKQTVGGQTYSIKQFYKHGSVGAAAGIGYSFQRNGKGVAAGLRYSFEFAKINNASVGGGDVKPSLLSLSLFYTLPHK